NSSRIPFREPDLFLVQKLWISDDEHSAFDKQESSLNQADPADQVLGAGIGAQGVEYGIAFEEREPEIALMIALFEPGEGLILVAETNVDFREVGWRYIAFLRLLLQIRNHLAGVRGTAHSAINVADRRVGFCREVSRLFQLFDGLLKLPLLGYRLAEVKMRGPKARL